MRNSFTAENTSRIVAAMSLVRCSKACSLDWMAISAALTGAELVLLDALLDAADVLVRDATVTACFFFLCGGVGSSTVDVDDDDVDDDDSDVADGDELTDSSEDPGSSS